MIIDVLTGCLIMMSCLCGATEKFANMAVMAYAAEVCTLPCMRVCSCRYDCDCDCDCIGPAEHGVHDNCDD